MRQVFLPVLAISLALPATSLLAQSITPAADGTGTIVTPSGNQFDITGGTRTGENLFQSFQRFGLDPNQAANFVADPSLRNILGRVVGGDPSVINGLIQVTGGNPNLYLMNPAGMIFGPGAILNVPADFTATTATGIGFGSGQFFSAVGTNNYATLVGNPTYFAFTLSQPSALINQGNLIVEEGQSLNLIGGTVVNTGTLSAPGGTLTLTAVPGTSRVKLSQPGSLLSLEIDRARMINPATTPASSTPVTNLPDLLTGGELPQATMLVQDLDGTVRLVGNSGYLSNQGRVTGAQLQLQAQTLVNPGEINASGLQGGQITLRASYLINQGRVRADGTDGDGGQIYLQATERSLQISSAAISAIGGPNGSGGKITLDAPQSLLSGRIDGSTLGQVGGQIVILGDAPVLLSTQINASGQQGGGMVLVGGDLQGRRTLPTAQDTFVNSSTVIRADALETGHGGRVILWAEGTTRFGGTISARGGALGGDGGFVEVSGKEGGVFAGTVDASAPAGQPGTLLLDPKNITIENVVPVGTGLTLVQTILNPMPTDSDNFSTVVALSGTNILIGARSDDTAGNAAGAIYLFDNNGALLQTIFSPMPAPGDFFGSAIAVDGNNILVGAPGDDTGAQDAGIAYLFDNNGNLLQAFSNPTPEGGDEFGGSVALSGTNILIGADTDDTSGTDTGAAYLFDAGGALLQTFLNPTPVTQDDFGFSLAIAGANIVIGARFDDTAGANAGAAYLFDAGGNLLQTFLSPAPTALARFGAAVAIAGNNVLIGGRTDTVYLFETNGNLQQAFTNPGAGFGEFGEAAIAIDGNNVLIGARLDDTGATDAGAAYLFDINGALLQTYLNPAPANADLFGTSVAIDGNNVLIGADGNAVGPGGANAAYLFDTNGALLQTLLNPTPGDFDRFGTASATDGTDILIGAPSDDLGAPNAGAAYLFDSSGALVQTFLNPAPANSDNFGNAVSLEGANVLIGVPNDDTSAPNAGIVYLFDRSGPLLQTLLNPTPANGDNFGGVVAMTGANILIGTPGDDAGATNAGAAYLFNVGGTLLQTLVNPTPANADNFGAAVAIAGTNILVGAPNDDTSAPDAGAAYLFDLGGNLLQTLLNPAPTTTDRFGAAVGISGTNIVIGAPNNDAGANNAGAAYLFDTGGTLRQTFANPAPADSDNFGAVVAIAGANVVIAAPNDDAAAVDSGTVYLFDTTGVLVETLDNPAPALNDQFGASVAIAGSNLVVGSPGDAVGPAGASSAYLYTIGGTPTALSPLLTFSDSPDQSFSFDADAVTQITNARTALILQASNDIVVNEPILTDNPGGVGGSLTFQAGRSILINASIATDDGNLTLSANDPAALAANRDAGLGEITIAAAAILDLRTGQLQATIGSGANGGNITTGAIVANGGITLAVPNGSVIPGDLDAGAGNVVLLGNAPDTSPEPGVNVNGTIVTTTGDISISGTHAGGDPSSQGMLISGTLTTTIGNITITGNNTNPISNAVGVSVLGAINAGAGNLTFAANELDLAGATLNGTGSLSLQPLTPDQNLVIAGVGGSNSALDLTTADLAAIQPGFGDITLGRGDSTGTVTINSFMFQSPVAIGSAATLIGDDLNRTWTLTGANSGRVDGFPAPFSFANVGNITAGSGNDTFTFDDGVIFMGNLDGGAGSDSLDYSAFSTPVTITLVDLVNIEAAVGSTTANTTLVARDASNSFILTRLNSGTVAGFQFTNIQTLVGGNGDDIVQFNGGTLSNLNAGAGNLTLVGDTIDIVGNISGTGDLAFQALTANRPIQLGGNAAIASELLLSTDLFSRLQNGFSSIQLGNATTSIVIAGDIIIQDPLRIYGNTIRQTAGTLTGLDNASLTITASQSLSTGNLSTTGQAIILTSPAIQTGNLSTGASIGGPVQAIAQTSITIGQINTSATVGNGGNVFLDPAGDIQVGFINAQGGPNGAGGLVDITTNSLFRATATFTDRNGVLASISTAGGNGSGNITLRHGGGTTPFLVGNGTLSGTASAITSGSNTLSPPFSVPPGNFTLGNILIITAAPPVINPPVVNLPVVNLPVVNPPNLFPPAETPAVSLPIDNLPVIGSAIAVDLVDFYNQGTNPLAQIETLSLQNPLSSETSQSLLAARYVAIEDRYNRSYAEYYGLVPSSVTPYAEVIRRLQRLEVEPGLRSALLYINFIPAAISPSDMGAALTNAAQDDDQLELMLITSSGDVVYRRFKNITRAQVTQATRAMQAGVTDPTSNAYLPPAQQLYDWLINPVAAELKRRGIENLVFLVDYPLRALPFAALYDGENFLVQRYSIGTMPSFSLTSTVYRSLQTAEVLAMGASEFDDRLPLPAVPKELRTITSDPRQGKVFLNEDFTLQNLRTKRQTYPFPILHLATHSEFIAGDPSRSFVQLWDGKLQITQVPELDWSSPQLELLVLSACKTALGDNEAELGFSGIAFYAGVRSVLGSLWYVSDEGTLVLMTEFYNQLAQTRTRSQALQQAQILMIEGRIQPMQMTITSSPEVPRFEVPSPSQEAARFQHPYYWAAFIMVGNPW